MPNYVWKAKDRFGESVIREIKANSGAEAKALLEAEGCTELLLMEDDVAEAAAAAFPKTVRVLGEEAEITAADRLKHYGKPAPTMLSILAEGLGQTKNLVFFMLALAALQLYLGHKLGACLVGVGLLAWVTFLVSMGIPSMLYHKLHKAGDWYRWKEVLDLVDKLERMRKIHFIKVPLPELGRWRAKAWAATGKLPEALAYYQKFENQPGCPSWLHKAMVAGIYDTAKQHVKALEINLQVIQERPSSSMYLDLANRYLRYKKDPVKAREALASADKEPIPEIAKPFSLRCRGILALLEGDYPAAKQNLEAAIQLMEKTRHVPFRDGHISIAKAYLCCVLAKQGQLEAARKSYAEAHPCLVATGESELIADCEQALGGRQSSASK
jgi:tetratricopeptide (TPR) repeat protein